MRGGRRRRIWLLVAMVMAMVVTVTSSPRADVFSEAVERERAHLMAERDALREASTAFDGKMGADVREAEARVASLRDELARLRREVARVSEQEVSSERNVGASLIGHLSHAIAVLRANGTVEGIGSTIPERSRGVLDEALDRLDAGRAVSRGDASFYLPDGRQTTAPVVTVGSVAQVAELDGRRVPLITVEEGTREARIDRGIDGGAAELFPLALTDVGLHDGIARRSLSETFRAGGLLVWPILILGLIGLAFVIERTIAIRNLERGRASVSGIVAHAESGRFEDAAVDATEAGGAAGRVLAAGLAERGHGLGAVDDALSEALLRESSRFQRFLPVVRVIAAVSPLLGLLGTVTGMISTFDSITTYGTGDPKLLSGGISEALITTELGLVVAIPLLLAHNILAGRVHRNVTELEEHGLALSRVVAVGRER